MYQVKTEALALTPGKGDDWSLGWLTVGLSVPSSSYLVGYYYSKGGPRQGREPTWVIY